jgi:hypothetical protein
MTTAQKPDALPVVAWRYVPSATWKDAVFTGDQEKAQLARDMGCDVKALADHADAQASLLAKEAECEALRVAIRDHNNDCESRCEQRQQDGDVHCPYAKYGRQCPDCPRDGMVDAAIDAARAAADKGGAS